MEPTLTHHIEIHPETCGGKPCIAGTRIAVVDVAIAHGQGHTPAEIQTLFSSRPLTLAEVYAALAYYFDYKETIDRDIEADQSYVEAFKRDNPSLLHKKLKELRGQ